jgi:hypothetical protein
MHGAIQRFVLIEATRPSCTLGRFIHHDPCTLADCLAIDK